MIYTFYVLCILFNICYCLQVLQPSSLAGQVATYSIPFDRASFEPFQSEVIYLNDKLFCIDQGELLQLNNKVLMITFGKNNKKV